LSGSSVLTILGRLSLRFFDGILPIIVYINITCALGYLSIYGDNNNNRSISNKKK
jgi:hypothetical protein